MDNYVQTNGIQLHYLEYSGAGSTLLLLPGLTANAHAFDGLIAAGLADTHHVVALDLRGRGLSDKPESGYTMADHAADVIGVLDALHLEDVILVGHSFGGLLALYLAAHHPERFPRFVLIDAAKASTDPRVAEMIKPSLARLGQTLPSVTAYLEAMKQMPFLDGCWDDAVESFFHADLRENPDGTAQPQSTPEAIAAVIDAVVSEDWDGIFERVKGTAVLINATEAYGPGGPIVTRTQAEETVALLPNCTYVHVPGNHVTMLFGDNAKHVAAAITPGSAGVSPAQSSRVSPAQSSRVPPAQSSRVPPAQSSRVPPAKAAKI